MSLLNEPLLCKVYVTMLCTGYFGSWYYMYRSTCSVPVIF